MESHTDNLNFTNVDIQAKHSCVSTEIQAALVPKMILMLVLAFFIVAGNGALILTILTHKYLRKKSNYFMIALACADFMLGFVSAPLHIMGEAGILAKSYRGCLVIMAMSCAQIVLSIMMLFALSLERYLKLVHPFVYTKLITERRIYIIIACCIAYSFLFGFLPLLGWNNIEIASVYSGPYTCRFEFVLAGSYVGVLFLGHIVPPFIILPIMHLSVFLTAQRVLRRQSLRSFRTSLHRQSPSSSTSSKQISPSTLPIINRQRNYRHFKILAVMGIYFIISWMPLTVWETVLWEGFTKNVITAHDMLCPPITMQIYYIVLGLAVANSAVNPFIFGAGNATIRRTFLRFLQRRKTSSNEDLYRSFGSVTEAKIQEITTLCRVRHSPETLRLLEGISAANVVKKSIRNCEQRNSLPRPMVRSVSFADATEHSVTLLNGHSAHSSNKDINNMRETVV